MNTISNSINNKKFEIAVKRIRGLLIYLERTFGRAELESFVAETGMDIDYLENDKNWISWSYHIKFLEKMVEYTGDADIFFKAARYMISQESYGAMYSFFRMYKLFSTPQALFKIIAKNSASFSNCGHLVVAESGRSRLVLYNFYYPPYKAAKVNCHALMSQFSYLTTHWGLPPAEVVEHQCAADGADHCIYELTWTPRPRREVAFLVSAGTILLSGTALYFLKPGLFPLHVLFHYTALVIVLFVQYRFRKMRTLLKKSEELNHEHSRELESVIYNEKLERLRIKQATEQLRENAEQLSYLNYVLEEVNKITNEDDLFTFVMHSLNNVMNYKRSFLISLGRDFEVLKGPIIYTDAGEQGKEIISDAVVYRENIQRLFDSRECIITRNTFFESPDVWDKIVILPFSIHAHFHYLMGFEAPFIENGISSGLQEFFQTFLREVEIALKNIHSLRAAQTVINSIPSTVITFNSETQIVTYINSSNVQENLYLSQDMLGMKICTILRLDDAYCRKFQEQIATVKTMGRLTGLEYTREDHNVIGYTLFKLPQMGTDTEIGIIMKNITEQKETREQLIRAEKLAALGTLASGVAHEVNNPLYGVLGMAEMIQDLTESDEIRGLAKDIIDYTVQASDIVKDLSSYSRSIKEEKAGNINLNTSMLTALRMVKYSAQFIDIQVEQDLEEIPDIHGLEGELQQIYINLFNNAIQAMDGRGRLILESRLTGNFVETTITDTGPGIPEVYLSRIFDPFFTTKNPGKGTGLGLNIVYRLVTKYNGFINVKSTPGEGTSFIIRFPVEVIHA